MFASAITWLNDPLNWTNPGGIFDLLGEHLLLSLGALLLACVIAWPLGIWMGHSGRGGAVTVVVANLTRAIPTMALLSLLPLTILGFGPQSVIPALAVFAIPPLLATAYTGMREVDPDARDAANGMGFSRTGILFKVEIPLAVPQIASGFRTAAVQMVATATLAALFNGGGLGEIISLGFGLGLNKGGGEILAGGLLVAGLALIVEGLLALAEKFVTPRALRELARAQLRFHIHNSAHKVGPMSPKKVKILFAMPVIAALAITLAACGKAGSSGTTPADEVKGKGCAPVAGDTLVALKDDKHLQASENIVAVFNAKAADKAAVAAVDAVAAKLTTKDLNNLAKAVDVDRKSPSEAATAFAKDKSLTSGLDKASGSLTVGHANFSESEIISNLYKITLEASGYTVKLKDVGNRETYLPSLKDNEFQVIPEYAASLTEALNPKASADSDPIASSDVDKTMKTLAPLAKKAGLKPGKPAAAANSNAYVVTKKFAKEHKVSTLSDFAKKCSGKASVLAGPPECPKRLYCQVGLEQKYGIQFGKFNSLDIGTASKQSVATGESTVGTLTTTDSALADGVKVTG